MTGKRFGFIFSYCSRGMTLSGVGQLDETREPWASLTDSEPFRQMSTFWGQICSLSFCEETTGAYMWWISENIH